jgi:hypothetical protein
MDIFWHILYCIVAYRFVFMAACAIVPALCLAFVPKLRLLAALAVVPVLMLGLLNMVFGSWLSASVVHAFGETGSATITGDYETATQYNDRTVVGHNVLLRTSEGKTVETSFEDDDFNVYPSRNSVTYPSVGDHFNVNYLRMFPRDFIIITNDDSPWATERRCAALNDTMQEANQKYEFDRSSQDYRTGYIAAIHALIDQKCVTDAGEIETFHDDIENVQAGRP